MAIVNFSIEKTLDDRLKRAIRERGFSSRAEYVRSRLIQDLDEWEARVNSVQHYYLKGKAALALDKEYDKAMAEYRAGKTVRASSIKEAIKIFDEREKQSRLDRKKC